MLLVSIHSSAQSQGKWRPSSVSSQHLSVFLVSQYSHAHGTGRQNLSYRNVKYIDKLPHESSKATRVVNLGTTGL